MAGRIELNHLLGRGPRTIASFKKYIKSSFNLKFTLRSKVKAYI